MKVYKISLDAGFTCPNRDGTLGSRGCIFCSEGGSGDFAASRHKSITDQIFEGRKRVEAKAGSNAGFIAYFQAFTNTYAPVDRLRSIYTEAINNPSVVAISIATRPDCLPSEVIDLLYELNRIKPVWVELGLQTIHEHTSEYIRRGYSLSVYDNAVKELKKRKLIVITHMIIGLPGESHDDIVKTASYIGSSGVDGIKLQLLHVLEGTDLAKEYRNGVFKTLEMDEYIDLVCDCIKVLPKNIVIHRITGDGDKRTLIAPLWSADKKKVLNAFSKKLKPL